MPGLQRAQRRLRSGQRAHARGADDGAHGREWVLNGQKVWTSLAQFADWAFVVCRTEDGSRGHRGLSYLLVPMRQPGVDRPPHPPAHRRGGIQRDLLRRCAHAAENVVGAPGEGWQVAMGTLAFERGVSTLGQQMSFRNELDAIIAAARGNGLHRRPADPPAPGARAHRPETDALQRAAHALATPRRAGSRTRPTRTRSSGRAGAGSSASWRSTCSDPPVRSPAAPYEWELPQRLFLGSRADTIYGGTNQIQRNIIAERALGLPKEPRGYVMRAAPQSRTPPREPPAPSRREDGKARVRAGHPVRGAPAVCAPGRGRDHHGRHRPPRRVSRAPRYSTISPRRTCCWQRWCTRWSRAS